MFVVQQVSWEGSKSTIRQNGKRELSGNNFKAEILCSSEELDKNDMVIDFKVLKEKIQGWINVFWDHATLIAKQDKKLASFLKKEKGRFFVLPGNATAEMIAKELFRVAFNLVEKDGVKVNQVMLWESESNRAICTRADMLPQFKVAKKKSYEWAVTVGSPGKKTSIEKLD